MPTPAAIGVDIGGTQLRAAVITADGEVLHRLRHATVAHDEASLLEALGRVITDLGPGLPVGVGIAGLVTPDGTVRYGPNIGVRDVPLAARLAEVTDAPVVVANDGSTAALAEQRIGAGRRCSDVLLVTLGTGIGGGVVLGGQVLLGRNGFAGEVGHVIVSADGRRCPCGNRGCIEAYASGTAMGSIARERLARTSEASTLRDADRVDGRRVTRAAADGDALAGGVLSECGTWLGIALSSLVNTLDPDIVLLGGGAAADSAPWLLPAARATLASNVVGSGWRVPPPVELAALGDDAGIVGAALLAFDAVRSLDPSRGERPATLGAMPTGEP